jgi:2-phosphosulfolactate phosphatase
MTTTNGTRALRACRGAVDILAASFLNLGATADTIRRANPAELLIVCSGTFEQAAYEDVLGAGALCDLLWNSFPKEQIADSAQMAREVFLSSADNPVDALSHSRNARRLLSRPDLSDDVAFCFQRDVMPLMAGLETDGWVRRKRQ